MFYKSDSVERCFTHLDQPILPLKYDVPRAPAAPHGSALPTTRGTLAENCTRGVIPRAMSTTGAFTSLRPLPDQRSIEIAMATPPESSTVASSTHAIGEAAPLPAVVIDGATRSLRLGGAGAAFLCP